MSRFKYITGLSSLVCVALFAAACSTPPPKPDNAQDKVADNAAQKTPDAEQEPAHKDTLPQADDAKVDSKSDKPSKISDGFKSDLASAIDDMRSGDRAGAISSLQDLVDDPAGGFLAAFNLGVVYESEGHYKKAAQRYAQSLGKRPGFSPALRNLVRLYLRLGQPRDADKIARKYINARPDNMTHRAVGLEVELNQGKYEEVIRKAKQILHRDEKNVEAMMIMAEANIQLGRYELAEAILDRARELRPNRAEIYFKYAKIRIRQDKTSDAITLLRKSIKLRPNYPEAHNNLGVLYHRAGDDPSAIKEFGAAIADYPDYKEAYLNLGNSLKGIGKFTKAEKAFKKALEIDAKYGDALFNLGVLYLDSDLEGIDKIAQLHTAVDYFTKYKSAMGSRMTKDDPADKYIAEARKNIKVEKQRQQMLRQAQMQTGGGDGSGQNGGGGDGGAQPDGADGQ